MALSTAPSFSNTPQKGMQTLSSQVAGQKPTRPKIGMGTNSFRNSAIGGGGYQDPGGLNAAAALNPIFGRGRQNPGMQGPMSNMGPPNRVQAEPLMAAPNPPPMGNGMGGGMNSGAGMIADNAPSMPTPPPMGGGMMGKTMPGMMAPRNGGMMEGPSEMGGSNIFNRYPSRASDPRFRY